MFGRKKKKVSKLMEFSVMKDISYPPKIILAWVKSLEGNTEISKWLYENDFKELIMTNQAIYLKEEARNWLMNNGYPHLMAMVNAAEGNVQARSWLKANGMDQLYRMAMAIDGEEESWEWLGEHVPVDIFLLTKAIEKIKNSIEENHNDVHSFRKD